MFTQKTICPVPFDQQPLNEYLFLKRSWLFSWSTSSTQSFLSVLFYISISLGFLLVLFSVIFTSLYIPYEVLWLDLMIVNSIIFLLLVRIYLGLSYVLKRLLSATVFYEESGWYDGQIWIKTSDYLMQDRLVGLYQVMPSVVRAKYTICFVMLNFIFLLLLKFFFV
uniref:Ycf36 n=1 Tax=Tolypiocladia glomerulata TaxID=860646 RepID=A0A1Z1MV83_9FLOR|nr:hypothetical protein [Tolypiocladia glomerulata]ARW69761.1 hypothetical protein [Tolypiocladia glomerulata]